MDSLKVDFLEIVGAKQILNSSQWKTHPSAHDNDVI